MWTKTSLTLMCALALTGCGKASLTVGTTKIQIDTSGMNPIGSQNAMGEVAQCPMGSNLIPSAMGTSAFCMDPVVKVAASYPVAIQTCGNNGQVICSIPQLVTACLEHNTGTAVYWSGTVVANGPNGYAYRVDGSVCGNGGFSGGSLWSNAAAYYCCSN